MGTCAFAVQDQGVMLRLIPKEIVQGEGNALRNERSPSRELCWVSQHSNGITAWNCWQTHCRVLSWTPWLFFPFSLLLYIVQVCFVHVLADVFFKFWKLWDNVSMTTAITLTVQKTKTVFNLLNRSVSKIFTQLNFHENKAFQILPKEDTFPLCYNSITLEQCSQY